jgi:pimeloyl-ACP methyl ester carboxylesterase
MPATTYAAEQVRERWLRVAGVRTRVLQAGPEDSTSAVVFVHGNPGSASDWTGLLPRVGEFSRALAIDTVGFGEADKPRRFDYSIPAMGDFLAGALEQLGVERAQLVLHDFGGPWGLRWADRHPGALASLVLIDTGVLIDYRWHYLARIWRTPVVGEIFQAISVRPAFRFVLRHGNPRGLPRSFVDEMHSNYDRATRRAVLKLYRNTEAAVLDRGGPGVEREVPTLVIWGKHDPYLPVEQAHKQTITFPRAVVRIFDRSGHWPFIDDPEQVAALVVPFLRRYA